MINFLQIIKITNVYEWLIESPYLIIHLKGIYFYHKFITNYMLINYLLIHILFSQSISGLRPSYSFY